jgi:hypothetical protein
MSHRPNLLSLLFLLILWSTASSAVEISIRGRQALEPGAAAQAVTLRLTPQGDDANATPEPVTVRLAVPGEVGIDLAPGILWRLETEAPDLWSEPRWLYPKAGEEAAPVALTLFPTVPVSGALALPQSEALPQTLEIRFEPSPEQTGKIRPPRASVTCPVREQRFQCKLPASVLDLRLRVEGFVPVYKWDVTLAPGPARDLGLVSLVRGSSVSGWVRRDGDKPASAECKVELAPRAFGIPGNPAARQGLQAMKLETRVNARGFFQIVGPEPGTYVLSAAEPGLARASVAPVEVRPGLETALINPLLLMQPAKLTVGLLPPLDPWAKPWYVHVQRYEKEARGAAEFERGPASKDGLWERTGLAPGSYLLMVQGDGDSRWLAREIEVQPGDHRIDVEIPVVQVEGRVTQGDEPLQATLWFGGLHGQRRIRFDANERGELEGVLPSPGLWEVDLVADGLRLRLPPVEVVLLPASSRAKVEIRVVDTRFRGEVVDEDGKPIEGAEVQATPFGRKPSTVRTDAEGHFEIRGIQPGKVVVEASKGGDRTSGWVNATVVEGDDSPWLRLVVKRVRTVQGRVFSAQGPVVGARVEIRTDLLREGAATVVQEVSGPAGEFSVTLPGDAQLLNVAVEAPGHAIRFFRTAVPPGEVLEIPVEPVGGTLILDLGEATPELVAQAGTGLLVHGGTFVLFRKLQEWARLGRSDGRSAHQLIVPNLEPGDYMLCTGVNPHTAAQNGGATGCTQGRLGPLQELVLTLPSLGASL